MFKSDGGVVVLSILILHYNMYYFYFTLQDHQGRQAMKMMHMASKIFCWNSSKFNKVLAKWSENNTYYSADGGVRGAMSGISRLDVKLLNLARNVRKEVSVMKEAWWQTEITHSVLICFTWYSHVIKLKYVHWLIWNRNIFLIACWLPGKFNFLFSLKWNVENVLFTYNNCSRF